MDKNDYLLICLAEESAEVIKAASKALRFGLDTKIPGSNRTNTNNLCDETNDLIAVMELLIASGVLEPPSRAAVDEKKERVLNYLAQRRAQ